MFCKNCGNKIEEGTLFCSKCGVKVENLNIVNETKVNSLDNINNNTLSNNMNNTTSNIENNQNTVNNNQTINTTNSNTKKNSTLFTIIIVISSIVILSLISIIVVKILSNNINNYQTSTSTNNNDVTEINNDNQNNNNEITLGNYKFKLPTDLLYKNSSDYILAANKDKTFIFEISVYNFSYTNIVNNYEGIVNEIQNSGITITSVNEVSYGSTKILLFDLNDGENVYQLYYTELDTNAVIGGVLQVQNANLFDTAFSYIDKIKNTKEKVGSFGKETKEEINIKNYKIREDSFVLKKD